MINNRDRNSLREFYEKTHPTKKVSEAYDDAKTEFSEPHAIQNLKGEKVLGIQVGNKTYYFTADVGKKYIASMQKVIDNLGGDSGQDFEDEDEDEFGGEFSPEDEENMQRNPAIMGEGILREAYTKAATEIAYNEEGKRLKLHFINLDDNMSKLLKSKFGKYYDEVTDIIHL